MAKFSTEAKIENKVPTGSMADIAFLLLIFFMATTIFRIEEGLDVELPKASQGQKLPRQHLAHIWMDAHNRITIDDALVQIEQIEAIMLRKADEDRQLVVAFNTDYRVPYERMHLVMEQLKLTPATNVAFNHDNAGGGS